MILERIEYQNGNYVFHESNLSVIPSQHKFYLIPGYRTWTPKFIKAY